MIIIPAPAPDSADFAELSMEQRNIVRSWLNAFDKHPVIKPITQWFQKVASYLEVSPATVKLKYYELKKHADWRVFVDSRLGIKPALNLNRHPQPKTPLGKQRKHPRIHGPPIMAKLPVRMVHAQPPPLRTHQDRTLSHALRRQDRSQAPPTDIQHQSGTMAGSLLPV